jgi:hypothetical protein
MNWIRQVGKKISADVGFFYLPNRIVAVIPKTALEHNTTMLQKTEDEFNIYIEFLGPSKVEKAKKLIGEKNPAGLV